MLFPSVRIQSCGYPYSTTFPTSNHALIHGLSNSPMYFFISSGLNKNLFQTSSIAITTFNSAAIGISSRICFCDLVHASKYDVCGFTTAGTSSTASESHSFAFRSDVRIPSMLFATTAASPDDNGYFQWSMFITESIRIPAASAAFFNCSASCSSGVVGACTTSNPASLASLNLSATLMLPGSMSNTSPFLIGNAAPAACRLSATLSAHAEAPGAPAVSPANVLPPMPVAIAAATLALTNSRRVICALFSSPSTLHPLFNSSCKNRALPTGSLRACPSSRSAPTRRPESATAPPNFSEQTTTHHVLQSACPCRCRATWLGARNKPCRQCVRKRVPHQS